MGVKIPTEVKLWNKISPEPNTGCWLWTGAINSGGYSNMKHGDKYTCAHRVSYEFYRGPIPEGMVVDHLCRVKSCVNPSHMEIVTQRTNVLRGDVPTTHCPNGHEYTSDNTYLSKQKRGWVSKNCRICTIERAKEYRRKKSHV